ncbi:MAG: RNA polymerase sigma factor, partial [Planctomycetota bacterium]
AALERVRSERRGTAAAQGGRPVSDEQPAPGGDPADLVALTETRAQVRAAVARLPEHEREALVLFEIEGLSMQEAGEVLGWSTAKMKVTVFRARRRLRDLLQPTLRAEKESKLERPLP